MNNIGKRLKNRGTLIALGSALILFAQTIAALVFGYEFSTEEVARWQIVGNSLLLVLTALGVLNDPTTNDKGYNDDRK